MDSLNNRQSNAGDLSGLSIKREKQDQSVDQRDHLVSSVSSSSSFIYSYKKTEKIAAAIYLVSDTLPDSETLKVRVRQSVLDLLFTIASLRPATSVDKEAALERVNSDILKLTSLLEIARFAGLFSKMNCAVLSRELHSLREYIFSKDLSDSGPRFDEGFLAVEETSKTAFSEPRTEIALDAVPGLSRSQIATPGNLNDQLGSQVHSSDHLGGEGGGRSLSGNKKGRVPDSEAAVNKNERRAIIMSLIRKEGDITVRDVSSVVSNCSPKTIQRELLSLVAEGVLKREGERRWSRYSFAD